MVVRKCKQHRTCATRFIWGTNGEHFFYTKTKNRKLNSLFIDTFETVNFVLIILLNIF